MPIGGDGPIELLLTILHALVRQFEHGENFWTIAIGEVVLHGDSARQCRLRIRSYGLVPVDESIVREATYSILALVSHR